VLWRSGDSAERRKLWQELKWRLSPEGRYAEIGEWLSAMSKASYLSCIVWRFD
jgi:hypothetical protein